MLRVVTLFLIWSFIPSINHKQENLIWDFTFTSYLLFHSISVKPASAVR